jgi:glycerophosphoryl diester phosphodiesterase
MASACSAKEQAQPSAAERRCAAGENLQLCGKNLVIAHRGGAKVWPEETLLAMQESVKLGVDVLEIDVHATSDGVVVCTHDDVVDRTTDGTGPIKDKTWADVQLLDAGAKFTADGGKTFPYKGKGIKIAKLEELLKAFPQMQWSVEIKQVRPSIVDSVLAVINATGMADKVVIASFDDDTLRDVRAKALKIPTSLAGGEIVRLLQIKSEEDIGDYVPPAKLYQAPYVSVTADKMKAYNKLGLRVHVWTVDDVEDQKAMWALGVHGVMSDDPVLLKTVTATDKGR